MTGPSPAQVRRWIDEAFAILDSDASASQKRTAWVCLKSWLPWARSVRT